MSNPAQTNLPKDINFDLEALRGFASLFVIWHHVRMYSHLLDPGLKSGFILSYAPSGHFCVLIFFVLSGYVIGISNKKPLTWNTSLLYLKKRLVRLYPIYIITLAFTLAVTTEHFPIATITYNLAMLQALFAIAINPLSWSLHYEILYYFLFIFISILRLNAVYIALTAFTIGITNYIFYPVLHTPIITSYCYGLTFWILGLALSRYLANSIHQKSSYQILLGCLFFILCIDQYNLLNTVSRHYITVSFPENIYWAQQAIEIHDLSYIPFALFIVLIFTGKKLSYKLSLLRLLILVSSTPKLIYIFSNFHNKNLNLTLYTWPTLFLLFSILCLFVRSSWLEKMGQQVMRVGAELGSLSYSIYLIHFPVILLLSKIHHISGTWQSFVIRFIALLVFTIGFSYILEKIIQPRFKNYFFKHQSNKSIIAAN